MQFESNNKKKIIRNFHKLQLQKELRSSFINSFNFLLNICIMIKPKLIKIDTSNIGFIKKINQNY